MAKQEKSKLKLIRLLQLMMEHTDDEHGLSMPEIISALDRMGIKAERKSIYDDLASLSEIGFTVDTLPTRPVSYYLADRIFELAELKLLVDAVQSSKFITEEKSRDVINKLKIFAGEHGAGELSRQVYVEGRGKTVNKSSIYTIDTIHRAINHDFKITFRYFTYGINKEKIYRRSGAVYTVSPYALIWNDEFYYMVGYDEDKGDIRNFRVDKMSGTDITEQKRTKDSLRGFNTADYTRKVFGMFGGVEQTVTLECDESLAAVIIDRFGTANRFIKSERGFTVTLGIVPSPNFYAWVMSFGSKMRIVSPASVREEFLRELRATLEGYE